MTKANRAVTCGLPIKPWSNWMKSVGGSPTPATDPLPIGKHRHGPTGTVRLLFEGQITKFANYADPERLPEVAY